ncbi:MAG: AAA family ATPase [Chloroflexi bacterium]|nr:AAA family ATPase [Chloroflexota bacterium]
MLKSLQLENFRGFSNHTLPLKQQTVIVGANNAGKSTVIEALRLVSLITSRYKNLQYSFPRPGTGVPLTYKVVSPSLENLDINFDNLFHMLGGPPAIITAEFTTNEVVEVYLSDQAKMYAAIKDSQREIVKTKSEASKVNLDNVYILPQVAPLARDEKLLNQAYVQTNLSSPLAPLHFRNQMRLMPDAYDEFRHLAAETWPDLRIHELLVAGEPPNEHLALIVNDGNFGTEVAWMGHGLQMWLQTIWFLARTPKNSIVILDEPDVYLHPDLQRKLFRLVRLNYRQVIVATHSIEIMSEANPREILVIERTQKKSRFADDHPSVQRLIDRIGSTHNIAFARLGTAKRVLHVEGDDLDFLNHFHSLLFSDSPSPLANVPSLPIGGWSGWDYAIGSTMVLHNHAGEQIISYCILDPDYHTPKQISEKYQQAQEKGIKLHIWKNKEIENYLLVPEAISRLISFRMGHRTPHPKPEEISTQIDAIAEEFREEILEHLGTEFLNEDRRGGLPTATRNARKLVDAVWHTRDGRWSLVSGTEALSRLSDWAHKAFGVSFGPMAVLREIRRQEIPPEMQAVLGAIEKGKPSASIRAKT